MKKFLFLDFDGVLHPSEVYRSHEGRIFLAKEFVDDGHFLFEHAPTLVSILAEIDVQVDIILSTTWAEVLGGAEHAKAYLPDDLQRRVIGATWDLMMLMDPSVRPTNRLRQIKRYVQAHDIQPDAWVAVDDVFDCRSVTVGDNKDNLVKTDQFSGLGSKRVQDELKRKLSVA